MIHRNRSGRIATVLAAFVLALAGLTLAPAAPASAAAGSWNSCPLGYFCAWSGQNATGSRCQWEDDSSNWYADCSWADTNYPGSVFNNGRTGRSVTIYRYTGYVSKIGGCVERLEYVNLANNYFIGSHQWVC